MSLTKYDHEHQYQAVTMDRRMYRCVIPDCRHTINASILVGRKAKCPKCEEVITVTDDHLRRRIIACIGCGKAPPTVETKKPERKQMTVAELLQKAREGI